VINWMFKRFHIRKLYLWSMSIFALLLFAVAIGSSYYFSVKEIIRTTTSYQERLLNGLSEKLGAQFASIESVSLSVVRNHDLLDLLSGVNEPYENLLAVRNVVASLNTLTFSTPSIFTIELYVDDPHTSGEQELVRFMPLSQLKDNEWYPNIEKSDFAWIGEHQSNSYIGEVTVVSFARKIYSTAGDYKGVVVINMLASEIRELMEGDESQAQRLLLDYGNRMITRTGEIDAEPYLSSITDMKSARNGHQQFPSQFLVVWTYVAGSDWLLIEFTPWDDLVAGSNRMAKLLLIVGVASFGVLVLFSLVINRKITEPIFLLLRAMNRFPVRESNNLLPSDYSNEFGQIFHGYNKHLQKIEELYQSLKVQYGKQKEAEISALQAMINPHFLYNTLDQLNWMAIKDGNAKMSTVLELTGKMLRIGLSHGESWIHLQEELEHIECYMQIQQIRLDNRIRYEIELDENMPDCLVPKLTLQPFVENCIRHGFHRREYGHIHIHCAWINEALQITISDDGHGLPSPDQQLQSKTRGGYGIRNVRERMQAFFGSDDGIEIKNRPEGGTQVILRFPWVEAPDQREEKR